LGSISCGKVQVSLPLKVSCRVLTLLPFEPVTSTTQISSAKTALKATAEMQLSANSNNINNASSFDNKPPLHFGWLLHLSIGYQKPFQTNHSKPYILKESKAKCNPHSSEFLDPNNSTRADCSKIWSTSHCQIPFQSPSLTPSASKQKQTQPS
jgi:hypothetical protein